MFLNNAKTTDNKNMAKKYDFKFVEPGILGFWKENDIYKKAKEKNKGKEKFYFLDGPPYTSGKVHIGTAWNKSLKDMVLRYKRMAGFDAWDRAGYDMHGLPTAKAVMKKLGLKSKEDIFKLGMDKFINACKKLCVDNMHIMNEDFKRMGVWMDFDNAYQSIKKEFIEAEWFLIKKAHEKERLYEGLRTMPWCPECETAAAKHELEYQTVEEDSIFLKFKLKGKENEYLIIWTTTPWTIPFNLAVMVNPELDYVKAKVGDEIWYLAKGLAGVVVQAVANKKLEILEEFKGDKMEGMSYIHPLYDELKGVYKEFELKSKNTFTVILTNEYVDLSGGSGLVHSAPGCGPEDYEVCHRYGIPPFNNLDERGVFPKEMGPFAGLTAKKDDKKFVEALKNKGALIETTKVEHEYAHCQRCHSPVIFRATKQWFFKVEDLKGKMIKANEKIKWVPHAAFNAFDSWLKNLRDNSITKQRFWGTPLPVWRCEACGKYDVIGNEAELKKLSGKVPKELHKPWIDEITIPCECGKEKTRIPDILDVWVDAGTASWNCLDYPKNEKLFKELFPADFILEGKDQIRGWFNLLMVASTLAFDKPSFKAAYMHGFVQDAQGSKMSKSMGNYILPDEVIRDYGADTLRYYMIGGSNPGIDLNYNFDDVKLKHKNMFVFWNLHNFLIDLANNVGKNPAAIDKAVAEAQFSIEERYITSKLNSTIEKVTGLFDNYMINEVPVKVEGLLMELSRTYIQLIRDKAAVGSNEEKEVILYTIYKVLLGGLKLFAPVAPFITEQIFLDFKEEFGLKEESIHLLDWPKADKKKIDKDVEMDMETSNSIVQAVLAAREKVQLGVRWPLKEVIITTKDENITKSAEKMAEIIRNQTNVKDVKVKSSMDGIKVSVKADFGKLGPVFGDKTPQIIAKLSTETAETIIDSIEKKNKFEVTIDGKKVALLKDHLIIEREVPEPFTGMEFRGGIAYINSERTEKLEAEGYAREIMRRVQSLRKNSGLQKPDRIVLFVKVDEELEAMLKDWAEPIQKKCGADKIKISSKNPAKKHKATSKEKVKGKEFEIFFDKV